MAWADDSGIIPPAFNNIQEEDASPSCFGSIIKVSNATLTDNADGTCSVTTGGGGGNSFETIDVPAGTDPVADSATDTLAITETSFLTITGTAASDTIDITQVTTDLGTDGLIAANAVALTTDTTGNYVAAIGDCTASEGASCFEGTAGTSLTFRDSPSSQTLSYDTTDNDFVFSDDLDLEDDTPHIRLTDTTAVPVGQDDFELYADANQLYLTNVTDSRILALLSDGALGTHARTSDALFLRTAGTFCPGTLSTSMDCEDSRVWIPANCTVQSVHLTALTAPTTQAIIVDVNECSAPGTCTTIDTGTKPQIAAGATEGSDATVTDTTLARGNYLGFDLDQVGSGTTGADLTVTVECLL